MMMISKSRVYAECRVSVDALRHKEEVKKELAAKRRTIDRAERRISGRIKNVQVKAFAKSAYVI